MRLKQPTQSRGAVQLGACWALHDINTHLEKTDFLLPVEWTSGACSEPRFLTGLGVQLAGEW